jgi:hypothetical protein
MYLAGDAAREWRLSAACPSSDGHYLKFCCFSASTADMSPIERENSEGNRSCSEREALLM